MKDCSYRAVCVVGWDLLLLEQASVSRRAGPHTRHLWWKTMEVFYHSGAQSKDGDPGQTLKGSPPYENVRGISQPTSEGKNEKIWSEQSLGYSTSGELLSLREKMVLGQDMASIFF